MTMIKSAGERLEALRAVGSTVTSVSEAGGVWTYTPAESVEADEFQALIAEFDTPDPADVDAEKAASVARMNRALRAIAFNHHNELRAQQGLDPITMDQFEEYAKGVM